MADMSGYGILFGNLFVYSEDAFKKIFIEYYKKNEDEILAITLSLYNALNAVGSSITAAQADTINTEWNKFRLKVLGTDVKTQLLVVYRGLATGKDAIYSQVVNQSDYEGQGSMMVRGEMTSRYGIKSGKLIEDKVLVAEKVQVFLRSHLVGFLGSLSDKLSDDDFKNQLLEFHRNTAKVTQSEWDKSDNASKTLAYALYGKLGIKGAYYGGRGLGKAYDAFMNHMANFEPKIYDFMGSSGTDDLSLNNIDEKEKSVYQQEGGIVKGGNFPELINDSWNTIGWWASGDILIVGTNLQPIYNIQLKTTKASNSSVFAENIAQIRKNIEWIANDEKVKKMNAEKYADRIFQLMKTTVSNRKDFDNVTEAEMDELIEQMAMEKFGVSVKIHNG